MDLKLTTPLPDEVVARIAEEERLRFQLREELQKEKKDVSGSKFLKFLNSAFGLLLFTSIFVTGLGGLWTWWNQRVKETESRLQNERKLMAEFDFRLYAIDVWIGHIAKTTDLERKGVYTIFVYRASRGEKEFQTTLPQFKNEDWAGIVSQLNSLGITDHFADAIRATRDLQDGEYDLYSPKGNLGYFAPGFLEARAATLHEYSQAAWKKVDPDRK